MISMSARLLTFISLFVCLFSELQALAEAPSILQTSVPQALVPSTKALVLPDRVTDGKVKLQTFRQQGECVSYSRDGKWIAYDCKHLDGYYNIHVCRPDGTQDKCLTELNNGLPHRHAGTPSWHSSMKYIAFAAEKAHHVGSSYEAIPGFGAHSDVWVMLADGSKAWQLTSTPNVKWSRLIIPQFSRDGNVLTWAEEIRPPSGFAKADSWSIKIADFVDTPQGPKLQNIRTFEPGGPAFYETYGLSPDGKKIIFCSDCRTRGFFHQQIFDMNIDGTNMHMLTDGKNYHEHATYSPDGRKILWMTSEDHRNLGTDWWLMNADGSDKRRLTHFNSKGYPESCTHPVWACLCGWAPDGTEVLGGVQYSLIKQEGRIIHMSMDKSLF